MIGKNLGREERVLEEGNEFRGGRRRVCPICNPRLCYRWLTDEPALVSNIHNILTIPASISLMVIKINYRQLHFLN